MTTPTEVSPVRSRRSFGAVLLVAACALACTLPVIGAVIAGTFFDRILDSPVWLALGVSIVVGVSVIVMLRRRGIDDSGGC